MDERNLEFSFEANIEPLAKAVELATRLLTNMEQKLASTAKAGGLRASSDDISLYVKRIGEAQSALQNLGIALQKIDPQNKTDLSVPGEKALDSLQKLSEEFSKMNQQSELSKESLASAGEVYEQVAGTFGALTEEINLVNSAYGEAASGIETATEAVENSVEALDTNTEATKKQVEQVKEQTKETKKTSMSVSEYKDHLAKATKAVDVLTKSQKNMAKMTRRTVSAMGMFVHLKVGDIVTRAAVESSKYVQVLHMFNQVLGENARQGQKVINYLKEVYGLSPTTVMRSVSVFYRLSHTMGVADDIALKMSGHLTQVSADLASLYDTDLLAVINNMQAGMQGMTRAVRKYGIDVRASTLAQLAQELGMRTNILTMSEVNRQGLRYLTVMRQTTNVMGDWAKSVESPTNQIRVFKEQIIEASRSLGTLFLGAFVKVLPYLNAMLMILSRLFNALALFFKIKPITFGEGHDDTVDDFDAIGDAAVGAGKKVKALLAPFDELNVLAENMGGASGGGLEDFGEMDPRLEQAIRDFEARLENTQMKAVQLRDTILEFLGFEFTFDEDGTMESFNHNMEKLIENIQKATGVNIEPLVNSLSNLWTSLKGYTSTSWDNLKMLLDKFLKPLAAFTIERVLPIFLDALAAVLKVLDGVLQAVSPLFGWLLDEFLTPLALWTGGVVAEALQLIVDALNVFGDWVKNNTGPVQELTITLGTFFALWKVKGILDFISVSGGLSKALSVLAAGTKGVVAANSAWIVQMVVLSAELTWQTIKAGIAAAKNALLNASIWLYVTASSIATTVTAALSTAMAFLAANPIVLVIAAIAALIAVVVLLVKNWDTVKEKMIGAWDAIKKALAPMANWFRDTIINPLIRFLNGLLGVVETVVNRIVSALNRINIDIPDWVPGIGGKSFGISIRPVSIARVPELAEGGIVRSPTLAMVGEGKYPEAVIPLGDSPQMADLVSRIAEAVGSGRENDTVINITAELDGDVIYKNQHRIKHDRGLDFGMGVFAR